MEFNNIQNEVSNELSLRGRVFNRLRENILYGKYKKDCELREVTIAKELGVSRTPVREALRQLELEGLVKVIPNKGAFVVGITKKDIEDIYQMRSVLEGLCAKCAAENITKEQLNMLDEIIYLSEYYAQKDQKEQLFELDNRFHSTLYDASGSRILKNTLSGLHHYVERVRKISLSMPGRMFSFNEEHKRVLEALKNRDGERAEKLANEHMINTIKNINLINIDEILY